MKKTLLSFLFIITGIAYSQTPGYMGKKFSIYYDPSFFVSINSNHDADDIHTFGINLRHDFSADYTITRSIAVGATAKFSNAKLRELNAGDYSGYTSYGFYGDVKESLTFFGVYIKNFAYRKKGSISPVGRYNKFEIGALKIGNKLTTIKARGEDENGYTYDIQYNDINDVSYVSTASAFTRFALIYTWGKQALYLDMLYVNTGFQIGMVLPDIWGTSLGDSYSKYIDSEETLHDSLGGRAAGTYFLNFTVGIGLLAF